jgi:hypothetical protein
VMIAVLTGMLLVTFIIRIGTLVFLVGIAPLALACHASPFTEGAAKLWWRSFGGLLATVTAQAFALHTTVVIFLDPAANLPSLGIPADPSGTFNLIMIACLLWATIKVPSLMRRYVTQGGGGRNPAGMFLRMISVQQLTGMLRAPLRRVGRTTGRGVGAAAAGRRAAGRAASGGTPNAATTAIPYWRPRMPRPTAPRPASAPGAGGMRASARPRVPAGTNPATAMPKTRPAWRGGTPTANTSPASGASPPRSPASPGVTPGAAMPRTRPARQNTPRLAPGTGRPGPRRRPQP